MARDPSKRKKPDPKEEAFRDLPADRPGLPAPESIREVVKFVSPQNQEYRILKTTEMDAYDKPAKPKTRRRTREGQLPPDPSTGP
jgi:hypothetical protein